MFGRRRRVGSAVTSLAAGQAVVVRAGGVVSHVINAEQGVPYVSEVEVSGLSGAASGLSERISGDAGRVLFSDRREDHASAGVLCEPFAIGVYAVQQSAAGMSMKVGVWVPGPLV